LNGDMAIIRLSTSAQVDIVGILSWTAENFGGDARIRYEHLIVTALRDIAEQPYRAGSVLRPELGNDIMSYHLRYARDRARTEWGTVGRPRHFLLFYRVSSPKLIGVGRILHDAMELQRHLPDDYGQG
jgi:toxin ParE1/3/4